MRSAAMAEALHRGRPAFPVLAVDWVARGLALGRGIYSPAMRGTSLGAVTQTTRPGGWSEITYGSGIADNSLDVVRATVDVSDAKGDLARKLATYDPIGSPARMDWASPDLVDADWEPLFRGIVEDWSRDGLFTRLHLKTDDAALRAPVPAGVFLRPEWSAAADGTIYGTSLPLVLGIHDSWAVTARGSMPAVNVRYDKDLGYWWLVSVGNLRTVTRVFYDGVPQAGGWSVVRNVVGGNLLTLLVVAEGFQPEKGVVVSVDCSGPSEVGLWSLGNTLTGAPDQLRVVLEEYAYRSAPLGGYRGPAPMLDAAAWDDASEWFALHGYESARRFGGDQKPRTAAEELQSFLDQHPWVRIWWTPLGQLSILVIDPDDSDPDASAQLDLRKHHEGGLVPFAPGDAREVYTQVQCKYLWSPAEQKYLCSYEAHDVAALAEKVPLPLECPWSQGRFTQDGEPMNPAPPADPVPPS